MWKPLEQMKFGKSILTLIHDPTQTAEIFAMSELGLKSTNTNTQGAIQMILNRVRSDPNYQILESERYLPEHPELTKLAQLPEGSLGSQYAKHMIGNGLKPDFYPVIKTQTDIEYLSMRLRQTHDLWHVITGFNTSVTGEIALQAFMLAQTHSSMSALLTGIGIFHTLKNQSTKIPDFFETLFYGYQMGRNAKPLVGMKWEEHWQTPLEDLRRQLGVQPWVIPVPIRTPSRSEETSQLSASG